MRHKNGILNLIAEFIANVLHYLAVAAQC